MHDYKDTLNLPGTEFPMKANLAQREPLILEKWRKINIYQAMRNAAAGRDKFILHNGPPYANGHIHAGHALNFTLKDIVVKLQGLAGFDAPFVPGWDCHGLPIELNVEKKQGKPGTKLSASAFRQACREYAASQIVLQREALQRLGVIGDWENAYTTMAPAFEADIIRSLARIMQKGHLQQGSKPVYWCLDCASALAEAEVEYADKKSLSIDVAYRVIDVAACAERFDGLAITANRISVPIWTTTPWTLPASQAVAIHPDTLYALVDIGTECLLLAHPLVGSVMQRYGIKDFRILAEVTGQRLAHLQLQHPFLPRVVPLVCGEHVTIDAGTGAVHTAPAHGVDDYAIGKQYQLPLDNPVGDDGCFIAATPLVGGMHVRKVDKIILAELQKHVVLLHSAEVTHSYPHCWRHKTPLIFRATPQWFISMDQQGLRAAALKSIQHIHWMPEWGERRMAAMLENRPDWCISRQRVWGVPIPLFLHKETAAPHPSSIALMEKVAERVAVKGIEAWYDLSIDELLGADANDYIKSRDVLDVWFDSGVTHAAVLDHDKSLQFPADLYLEGSDQYRGWFQSALLTSLAMKDVAPYRSVLTHGFLVDPNGHKMSKSLGNVIAPEKIIQTLGADVLRLWVASTDYRTEVVLSDELLQRTGETYRRIRNTARFLLANLAEFDPATDVVAAENLLALDAWVVDHARTLQQEITAAYRAYQFHVVVQKIHHFCAITLGGFYLDIIKDRQYTTQRNSRARRSAQTAIYHLLEAMVRWMAPVLSFTAEELWDYLPGKRAESVFLTQWYDGLSALSGKGIFNAAYWEKIRLMRDAVNREVEGVRKSGQIGSSLEARVALYCDAGLKKELDLLGDELRFVLITSGAEVALKNGVLPAGAVATDIDGFAVAVHPLQDTKCVRCWHRRADVGQVAAHPTLCTRCVANVVGAGEVRRYA